MTRFARCAALALAGATMLACRSTTRTSPAPTVAETRPAAGAAPRIDLLRIDPLTLLSVREYRRIMTEIGPEVFPNWRTDVPMLLYRPMVQDILVGAPRRPRGYSVFTGPSPLAHETIYARNDSTLMPIDGQNTNTTLDSMPIVVLADRASRERSELRVRLADPSAKTTRWLDEWAFLPSPYDDLEILMHESFHVHQERLAPGKRANEAVIARYPALDPVNNALLALEGHLIRDALLASDSATRRQRAEQFVAVRHLRRATLDSAVAEYENLNEYSEGLGRYVELRFDQIGQRLQPDPDMYLQEGFRGYGALRERFVRTVEDLIRTTSNSPGRFDDPLGGMPVRFRMYGLGATQGLLLDQYAPRWKERIFAPGVYLSDLLSEALPLSKARETELVALARQTYGYDSLFANRKTFESEGRRRIQTRVDSIVRTSGTLVVIDYGDVRGPLALGYTPFGVTAVSDSSAIYDLVPIAVRFPDKVVLRMKSVIPAIVDQRAHTVTFAIATPASALAAIGSGALDLREFSLNGGNSAATTITVTGNRAVIRLR